MENFDISRFMKVLTNNKIFIFLIILLFVAIGYFYSFYYVTPMYMSSATVVLVQNDNLEATDTTSSITRS